MNALNHDVYDEGVHARLQVLNVVIEENGYQLEINDGVSKVWNVLVQDNNQIEKMKPIIERNESFIIDINQLYISRGFMIIKDFDFVKFVRPEERTAR